MLNPLNMLQTHSVVLFPVCFQICHQKNYAAWVQVEYFTSSCSLLLLNINEWKVATQLDEWILTHHFLIFQPVSWELPVGELHPRSVQQCLPHVHLLHCQWEVQRECPCLGGKKCRNTSKFRLNVIAWWPQLLKRPWETVHSTFLQQTLKLMVFYTTPFYLFDLYQVFKKEPNHFPFFFKCVMEAVLAGDEAGLTLKEQTVLLVFLDHCFNSLVCTTTMLSECYPYVTLEMSWVLCCG